MRKNALAIINPNEDMGPSYELFSTAQEVDLPPLKDNLLWLPFLGRKLSCGLFGISDDFIEKYQSLDQRFVKNKASTFFFHAVGDSMTPTIFPGEVLVVDRSLENYHGRVCVVAYQDALICKRVFIFSNRVELKSDNPKHATIVVENAHDVILWGVVIARAGEVK